MTSLEQVHCFVAEVWRETKHSSEKFPELFRNGEPKYPIPFFGNLLKAEILTVGLNPSADEFNNRGWKDGLSKSYSPTAYSIIFRRLTIGFSDGVLL